MTCAWCELPIYVGAHVAVWTLRGEPEDKFLDTSKMEALVAAGKATRTSYHLVCREEEQAERWETFKREHPNTVLQLTP